MLFNIIQNRFRLTRTYLAKIVLNMESHWEVLDRYTRKRKISIKHYSVILRQHKLSKKV